jgi:hypothetical protein
MRDICFNRKTVLQAVVGLIALAAILIGHPAITQADLPPRPTPDLPERPEWPVNPTPSGPSSDDTGGHIELTIQANDEEFWTEVEWVDHAGGWHLVEGWRTQTLRHAVKWFVRESDFRKGPFRWQIYERPGGRLLGSSDRFFLPAQRNEVVRVHVILR